MRDKFTIRGLPPVEPVNGAEPLHEVLDFYSNQGVIPMWMRTFLGYSMKIWLQWLMWKRMQNEKGIPGNPEHREINPDDRVYFLTDQEIMSLVHAADAALLANLVPSDEDCFQIQIARAKIGAAREINSREDWMLGPNEKS